jgi:hypothetical protein
MLLSHFIPMSDSDSVMDCSEEDKGVTLPSRDCKVRPEATVATFKLKKYVKPSRLSHP